MEMVFHEEEAESSMIYESIRDASASNVAIKKRSGEDSKVHAAVPVTKSNSKQEMAMIQLQTNYHNLTTEKDQLQERFEALQKKIQDIEASFKNLTEERAALKRMLNDFGWLYFSGSFYHISSTAKTWQESRDDCLQKHADLMIINSKAEQDFANQFKKRMWIGLTDSETEGTWKWVDGTPVTKSYWSSKEPNGGRKQLE